MLGFTAELGVPIALQDCTKRYDLPGEQQQRWKPFCKKLRSEYGLDKHCLEWDRLVADILLKRRNEIHSALPQILQKPFTCVAGMLDMAELIYVAERPFAVMHGGQIRPCEAGWEEKMHQRITRLLPGQTQAIHDLMACAKSQDALAKNDRELEFFHKVQSGGTYISSGLNKALEIIEKRYNPIYWNIYSFYVSDGDNWSEDNERTVKRTKLIGLKIQTAQHFTIGTNKISFNILIYF